MKVIGFFAVSALGALAAPDATLTLTSSTYTWMEDKTYDGESTTFWKSEAGNTGLDCANRCESMVGCVGFTLQYEDGGSSKASECKGQVEKAGGGNGIEDVPGYLEGSKYGFYSRDAAVTVAAAFKTFKGTNLADTDIPDGYAGLDHINCQSQEQGDGAYKQDKMQMGSDTKPGIAKCAELCDSMMGCQAFSINLGGTYSGMCIGYSGPTEGGNAYGCNVETGKPDEALFLRLGGKVTEPGCAPAGTTHDHFNICDGPAGGDAGAFSGAPVTSASVSALLLAPLVAVLLA